MRVCLASNLYPPDVLGGAEVVVGYLANGLQAAGHEVTVVTTAPRGRAGREILDGIRVHRLDSANLYWAGEASRQARALKPLWHLVDLWNPVMYRRLRRLLLAERFDVVHTHNLGGFSPSVWSAAAAAGLPLVHTPHDHSLTCVRAVRMTRRGRVCERQCTACALRGRWLQRLSRAVHAVVAPARFVLARHLELGFFPGARAAIVSWGAPQVPTDVEGPRREDAAQVRFLFVGGLRAHKGIGVMLEAFQRVRLPGVSLDIAGAGDMSDACARAASRDPRIRFHGFVASQDKEKLFRASDVLLLPSICWEVVGLVMLEARAYGLPVVASRTGGIPEFIEEGRTGLLVEPGDAAGLAGAIRRLAEDPVSIKAMRDACRARARECTWERTVDRLVPVYDAVLANRPANSVTPSEKAREGR